MPKIPLLPYVRAGLSEGLSANQAFRNYQEAARQLSEETGENWTAGRRTVFLQTFSATLSARANVPVAMNAPKTLPGGGLPTESRPTTRPGGYLNWVVAFTRPIGSADVEKTFHPVRTTDLLTPQQVEDIVRQDIEESAADEHGTFSRYTIEALTWTGTEELIPQAKGA